MVFKSFRLNCSVRLLFLSVSLFLLFYLLYRTSLLATPVILGILIVAQIVALFRYIERTNRDLTYFLDSIKYSDFSQSFSTAVRGSAFSELNEAFNEVIKEFQRARAEKEEHYRYLQTVVQHIGVGLIVYREDGAVELINSAAKRLLGIPQLISLKHLRKISPELSEKLEGIEAGERAQIRINRNESALQLSIYATKFRMRQRQYTLVSLQNIQPELEEKEMEAWQNLIRVLTHEIMNSITPIASLASTTNTILTDKYGQTDLSAKDETLADVSDAIKTIERRSRNLMNFVDDYRKLTRIPKPNFQILPVRDLLNRTLNLMKDQFEQKAISCQVQIDPETLEITADPALVEQVLINLCKNAVEAMEGKESPVVKLNAKTDVRGNPIIQVCDNGPGIKPEIIERIFIPFFTTKKEGSGIGLSLSRQIMRLHGGILTVVSRPGEETTFNMRF